MTSEDKTEDNRDERSRAVAHLFDYYLTAAARAMDALVPAEAHYRPRIPPATTALAIPELVTGGHYADAMTIYGLARDAACLLCDRAAEATALANLGSVTGSQGQYEQAVDWYQQALTLRCRGRPTARGSSAT